jgi:trk system potassium uptake protein TrkH
MKKIRIKQKLFNQLPPASKIVVSFLAAILVGTILLDMPFATKAAGSIGFINALFTATSAVCVTGLVVADTASTWSAFGQTVIIILIQIGGLGIMTAAYSFILVLGKRMGLKERMTIRESLNEFNIQGVVKLFRTILIATFSIELAGVVLLSTRFIPAFGFWSGLGKSIFHSISAFCNAGFDIMGTVSAPFVSITGFNNDPIVVLTIAFLFIIGGLGFVVWKDILQFDEDEDTGKKRFSIRRFKDLMLHSKVVLIMTSLLIVLGTALILIFEFDNTLDGMGFIQKLGNAFFHAVTPRTAGFNTLPVENLQPETQFLTAILMFIGAAPGSTGGGIKITTMAIIVFAIFSYLRSSEEVNMLKRKIAPAVVRKAIAIFFVGISIVFLTTFVLLLSGAGTFKECIFEAISAFGTVGLSTGITPALPLAGKIAITMTMFVGRVGPLALAVSLTPLGVKKPYQYPEGKISVG